MGRGRARILATLSGVLATRVLGLSLVVPVFPLYGQTLTRDLALVGVAFGAYGLAMALLQIPLGMLSDRRGPRVALGAGLTLSLLGTVACAFAPDVWTLTAARFLAGAGAVSGVAFAWIGETFDDRSRTTAMAVAGVTVGAAFPAGVIAGSLLGPLLGAPGLFLVNAALIAVALLAALTLPGSQPGRHPAEPSTGSVFRGLADPRLLRLNVNGFALNFFRDAVIFTAPLLLLRVAPVEAHWKYLAPAVLLGGLAMGGTARLADRGRLREVVLGGLLLLTAGGVLLQHVTGGAGFIALGAVFFAAHATLSAALPSLTARIAGETRGGTTQSALQVSQYLGLAAGGAVAGALFSMPWLLDGVLLVVGASAILAFLSLARVPATPTASAKPLSQGPGFHAQPPSWRKP